jgi:hypothetical protein
LGWRGLDGVGAVQQGRAAQVAGGVTGFRDGLGGAVGIAVAGEILGVVQQAVAWNMSLIVRNSASRPVSGASSPSIRWLAPTQDRTRVARHSSCGSAFPLS